MYIKALLIVVAVAFLVCGYYFFVWLQAASYSKAVTANVYPLVARLATDEIEVSTVRGQARPCMFPIRVCVGLDVNESVLRDSVTLGRLIVAVQGPCEFLKERRRVYETHKMGTSGEILRQIDNASIILGCATRIEKDMNIEVMISFGSSPDHEHERKIVDTKLIHSKIGGFK